MSNCFLLIVIILLFYFLVKNSREPYKKQRRQNIRSGWRRHGKSGQTVAKTGTRYPQWPNGKDSEFIFNVGEDDNVNRYIYFTSDDEEFVPTLENFKEGYRNIYE